SIDIECSEKGELFSIGFYGITNQSSIELVLMINPDKASRTTQKFVRWVSNEKELLQEFVSVLANYDPDIIIGWNVVNFDFRVLILRANLHQVQLRIGRGNTLVNWRESRQDRSQGYLFISGRVVIDGISALKSEAYNFPSFSLEAMAQHFLGEGKETESVDNRLETILSDFKHNKLKLAKYNLKDCELVWRIFEKAKLLDFLIFRSHLTGLELDRAGGSVASFTNLYLPQLHRKGYISPNLPLGGGLASPGGYVMDSKPGFYRNVLVLDFKSLYPSIIRTFKIDPLGLIEGLKDPDNSVEGYKGAVFHREINLLPDIIKSLWAQRDQAKKQNDKAKSQAIKILMNSFYGVLGSGGCPFYDPRLASSITLRGHWIMKQTAHWIKEQGFEVIYGDTDSTFVLLGEDFSAEDSLETGSLLQEFINTQWQLKLKKEYDLDCYLELEFETHFRRFLMPTIRGSEKGSKKRYAGLVGDGEDKRVVFKGLENVRTDWTLLAREFQEKLYALVFNEEDPSEYILEVIQQVKDGKLDDKLVYRKRLRKRLSEYVKNIPPHVKAAKVADEFLQSKGRKKRYINKGWIKYVITTNGPQPMERITARLDYQHYIDKQIAPIAEAILPFIGLSFAQLVDEQLGLF
ncbi:MAG: DNA polymerase II, partial [Kangiellaceae bacterium]|nr:DNA polymerase II [Kangiellaceae bacterium]